jgi:hypothetical protein
MPKLKDNAFPSYRLHRQSGQAIVTLSGRDILLGKHGSTASKEEYRRLTVQWIAAGHHYVEPSPDMTIAELINVFRIHAEKYYQGSAEADNFRCALRPLRKLYGQMPASEFGPLKLKAVREVMINAAPGFGWSRKYANRQTRRIIHLFAWAAENEHVSAAVYQKIAVVKSLRAGRSAARETAPVEPVAETTVEATIPCVAPPVAAMIKLQLLSAARGGELFKLRTCDLERSGPICDLSP